MKLNLFIFLLMIPSVIQCQSVVDHLIKEIHEGYLINEKRADVRSQLLKNINGTPDSIAIQLDQNIAIVKSQLGEHSPVIAFLYHRKGIIHYSYQKEYELALLAFREAVRSRAQSWQHPTFEKNDLLIYEQGLSVFNIAATHSNLNHYQQAIDSFMVAERLFDQLKNTPKKRLCYQHIGSQNYHLNNIYEAKHWLEKALEGNPNGSTNAALCLDLGLVYNKLNQYDKAIEMLEYGVQIYKSTKAEDEYKLYNELGLVYRNKENYPRSLECYNNALIAYDNYFDVAQNKEARIDILANIGMSYLNASDFETAKIFLDSSMAICNTENCNSRNSLYHNLGDLYLRKGAFESSIQQFQKAIHEIVPFDHSEDIYKNPSITEAVNNIPNLIQDYELKGKAFYQWYQQSANPKHLNASLDCYQILKALMQRMQHQYANENTELFWLDAFYPALETGLEVGYEQYVNQSSPQQKEAFFDYMLTLIEQNKANVLLENLRKNKALRTSSSFISQSQENETTVASKINEKLLDKNTAFLEYFVGDQKVFLICITQSQRLVYQFTVDSLHENIQIIRQLLDSNSSSVGDYQRYGALTTAVYTKYLAPALNDLPSEINSLIVVKDGPFNNIPIDLLLTSHPKGKFWNRDTPYLLRNYTFNYGYSASVLLEQMNQAKGRKPESVVAFAPSFDNTHDPLNNEKEVAGISQMMNAESIIGDAATLDAYRQSIDRNVILHMATHAYVNSKEGTTYIALSQGDQLKMQDIYLQPSNAAMVVLSACKTGAGTQKRGEGVMSLARAFSSSGTPSTTMSMWSVNDNATTSLMQGYYKQLDQGDSKPEALRTAKLQYLDQVKEKLPRRFFHPYYWGAFVHYGAPHPVYSKGPSILFFLFGIFIGTIGCAFVYNSVKKTR